MSEQIATYLDKPLSDLTLMAVQAEALRAHLKHGYRSLLNPNMPWAFKLSALMEEVGEVAHELTYDQASDRDKLVKELLQVASVALTWVESLESKKNLLNQRARVFLPGTEDPGDVHAVCDWKGIEYRRARGSTGPWLESEPAAQGGQRWRAWNALFDGGALIEVRGEATAALVENAELAEA